MNNIESTYLNTPPDSIAKKEEELGALLARVLDLPLSPVRSALNDLVASTARMATRVDGLASEVSAIDESVRDVKKSMPKVLEKHDLLDRLLDEAFGRREQAENGARDAVAAVHATVRDVLAETARATQLADDTAASTSRDRELLNTYRVAREEAQLAAQAAASRGRILLWLIVAILAAICGDIAINVAVLVNV